MPFNSLTRNAKPTLPRDDTRLEDLPMLALDLETTGLDVVNDRIVQIGAFSMQGSHRDTVPVLDCLINPGVSIPAVATRIHGISNAHVAESVAFADVVDELLNLFDGRIVIGHHIGFDLAVLRHEAARAKLDWHDPVSLDVAMLAASLEHELPDNGLESVASWLGTTVTDRHTAVGDSRAAADIFARLLPRLRDRNIHSLGAARALIATRDDLIQQQFRAGWHTPPCAGADKSQSAMQQQLDHMREIKEAQVDDTRHRLEDGVSAIDIQAHINAVNFDLHHDVIDLCIREMEEQGEGAPPVNFDAIILGSGGRYDSLLYPDQDNGFVIADVPENDLATVDRWFRALAMKVVDGLATVGFYRCPGWVMATNPRWRKTQEGFRRQLLQWIFDASGDALHYCNVFLDFHSFYGTGELTRSLREYVTERAANRHFLERLYDVHQNHTGALGWFNRIHTDPNPGPNQGKIDLKTAGTMPIVTAARLLSLLHGVQSESTVARMRALHDRGLLNQADDLLSAYATIIYLLLRQQVEDHRMGAPMGNHVPPDALNREERNKLVAALRVVRDFCAHAGKVFCKSG